MRRNRGFCTKAAPLLAGNSHGTCKIGTGCLFNNGAPERAAESLSLRPQIRKGLLSIAFSGHVETWRRRKPPTRSTCRTLVCLAVRPRQESRKSSIIGEAMNILVRRVDFWTSLDGFGQSQTHACMTAGQAAIPIVPAPSNASFPSLHTTRLLPHPSLQPTCAPAPSDRRPPLAPNPDSGRAGRTAAPGRARPRVYNAKQDAHRRITSRGNSGGGAPR
jgi:hypothetical protein